MAIPTFVFAWAPTILLITAAGCLLLLLLSFLPLRGLRSSLAEWAMVLGWLYGAVVALACFSGYAVAFGLLKGVLAAFGVLLVTALIPGGAWLGLPGSTALYLFLFSSGDGSRLAWTIVVVSAFGIALRIVTTTRLAAVTPEA